MKAPEPVSAKSLVRVLFLDLNSYFASVEQHARPELRGRPVAVAAVMTNSTCCLAASREAKQFGIKTGTPIHEARQLCPGLIVVPSRTELYVRVHHEILRAVDTCIPIAKTWSIDEMECRLIGRERHVEQAMALGQAVKQAILARVGPCLTCSVGLAPNRMLAKLATDMQKPDGLVCITAHDLPHILFRLKLTDLIGIGRRMEQRLNRQGIRTIEELCSRSKEDLVRAWGSVQGADWWHWLRGEETADIPTCRRSIGHEHVLPPELRNPADARAVLVRLIHKAAIRLRQEDYLTGDLSLYMKLMNNDGFWEDHMAIVPPCRDTFTLLRAMTSMWDRSPSFIHQARPLKVAVALTDLIPRREATLPLFGEVVQLGRLADVVDRINTRFGQNALYAASMHRARSAAPARIAFGAIPRLEDSLTPPLNDMDPEA